MTAKQLGFSLLLSALLALPLTSICAPAEWHVKEAPIRFKLSLGAMPTHPSAGYFVQIPDGGTLPGPFPVTQVITTSGKTLKSYAMWHNKNNVLAMVFESDSSANDVYVYVTGGNKLNLWTPASGITPSAIVCTLPGAGTIESARTLGKMGSVGTTTHFRNDAGIPDCLLCLQGDKSGRPAPSSFYMLTYLDLEDAGKTWIVPIVQAGNCEVKVNDRPMSYTKKSNKWGGSGMEMDLKKGLQKIEMLAGCGPEVDYNKSLGIIWFTWKPEHATVDDLGGLTTNAPYAGTPKFETRLIRNNEIVRSGSCSIREVTSREGDPAAAFTWDAQDVFWFENNDPIIVYRFSAMTEGNPKDTTYSWSFGDSAKPTEPQVTWFFPGLRDYQVTLTTTSGKKEARCSLPLFTFATIQSSLDSALTRDNFRKACLSMIKSYPPKASAVADWDKATWDLFYQVQELGKGAQLLAEVLINRKEIFKGKIPPEKQADMEDAFFHSISFMSPEKALAWLVEIEKAGKTNDRRAQLKIMQAELYMYNMKNFEKARELLKPIATQGTGENPALASIRLGDIAFMEKNINEANRYWGLVQRNVRLDDKSLKAMDSVKWLGDEVEEAAPKEEATEKKVDRRILKPLKPLKAKSQVEDWKKSAVLDTGIASSVIALLKQGSYQDAYTQLRKWERNFPTSKMTSDYIIQEANFYNTIGNRKRARAMLEAYCDNVDASSYLANAAEMLFMCMMQDREPDDTLAKFCEKMKKRFQFHPFADRVDSMLRQIRASDVPMDKPIDEI